MCDGEFVQHRAKQLMCSKECRHKSLFGKKNLSPMTHEKLRQNALRRHAKKDGNIGFTTRKKFEPSFPEKVTEDFFARHSIEFEREVRIGRWFADFVFNGNTVLEIDGKQHELPERKESDRRKDEYLVKNGYSVTRVPFNGLTPEFFEKLNEFLQRLRTIGV